MGRFYFHLNARGRLIHDEEGEDLPSFFEAQREATRSARELLAEAIKVGKREVPDALVIADEDGRALETISLVSVLPESVKR